MKAEDIKKVCCYGAGLIGASWATLFAWRGLEVNLLSRRQSTLDDGIHLAQRAFATLVKNGVVTEETMQESLGRIRTFTDPAAALDGVQYIQENARETYETKHEIVGLVETYAPTDAIFGSSTSTLLISEIAAHAVHRERYIGAHPYNPPHLIPLVELTVTPETDKNVLAVAKEFFTRLKRVPVVLEKETHGFLMNRIQYAVAREIQYLVGSGVATLEDVEKALTFGPGMRWAIVTPSQTMMLGSRGGVEGIKAHIVEGSGVNLMAELAAWDSAPPEIRAVYNEQQKVYASKFPGGAACMEDASDWRDDGLIQILRFHNLI